MPGEGGQAAMTFEEVVDQALTMLQRRGRVTYRLLQRHFQLDDAALEDLKEELIYGQRMAEEEEERVLVWRGETAPLSASVRVPAPDASQVRIPLLYAIAACGQNSHHARFSGRGVQARHGAVCRCYPCPSDSARRWHACGTRPNHASGAIRGSRSWCSHIYDLLHLVPSRKRPRRHWRLSTACRRRAEPAFAGHGPRLLDSRAAVWS